MNLKLILGVIVIGFFTSVSLLFPMRVDAVRTTRCSAAKPLLAPVLLSATPGKESVLLTWTPVADLTTHYVLTYGLSREFMEYGNPRIEGKDTNTFTVDHLTNGVKYYFRIRAVNECAPGKLSNTLSARPGTSPSTGTKSTKLPNLSIYRPVLGASAAATAKPIKKLAVINSYLVDTQVCKQSCMTWQLLLGEFVSLLILLYISSRIFFVKPLLSVIIPILTYVAFLRINGTCVSPDILCKYFLPLNIIIFIIAVLFYKHRSFSHTMQTLEHRVLKTFL